MWMCKCVLTCDILLYMCVDASVVFMRAERDLGFTACDAETLDHALRGTLRLGISFDGEAGVRVLCSLQLRLVCSECYRGSCFPL